MKICCDYCHKEEASVFCSADEAALCTNCDHRVHHANKLAGKHLRFSLIHPTSKEFPLCDICQEGRALVFCKEDRAILCRKCDVAVHEANEHAKKHNRFLLTGIKLSAAASEYSSKTISSNESTATNKINTRSFKPPIRKPSSSVSSEASNIAANGRTKAPLAYEIINSHLTEPRSTSTSSISDYLMTTIPGWRVEDLLDLPQPSSSALCKNWDCLLPSLDQQSNIMSSSFPSQDLSYWVPQVPNLPAQFLPQSGINPLGEIMGLTEADRPRVSRRWDEEGITVPEICPPLKKPRHLC